MFRRLLFYLFFLVLASGYGQTRVVLEDQCNCKVLHGDDVNNVGDTTPTGAELGDLYVNTQTGRLFFWNGNSWATFVGFGSDDDSVLQNANLQFDVSTGILSLDMGNGHVVTADLSALNNTGTDDQTAEEVPYNNQSSGLSAVNVQDAIDEVRQISYATPTIFSAGKIAADGQPVIIHGATVTRINEGDYQIRFLKPISKDYIIQISVLDCDGDCPGNTTDTYDNPNITYYDQERSGFKVNIGDSDNGANPKDDIDIEFMFTAIVLPF